MGAQDFISPAYFCFKVVVMPNFPALQGLGKRMAYIERYPVVNGALEYPRCWTSAAEKNRLLGWVGRV